MDKGKVVLRAFALLIGLRALTNVFKPLGAGSGLVFFGTLLKGTANTVLAPLLGCYMLAYVYSIWRMRRFALPMGVIYGIFVLFNLVLFPFVQGLPPGVTPVMYTGFALVGAGVTWGAVWLLAQRKQELA